MQTCCVRATWRSPPPGGRALLFEARDAVFIDLVESRILSRWKAKSLARPSLYSDTEALRVGNDGARWVEAETGATRGHAKDARGAIAAVTTDGAKAAVIGFSAVYLVGRDQPAATVSLPVGDGPKSLAFSTDGSRLAVGCQWGEVFVFDVDTVLATRPSTRRKPKG